MSVINGCNVVWSQSGRIRPMTSFTSSNCPFNVLSHCLLFTFPGLLKDSLRQRKTNTFETICLMQTFDRLIPYNTLMGFYFRYFNFCISHCYLLIKWPLVYVEELIFSSSAVLIFLPYLFSWEWFFISLKTFRVQDIFSMLIFCRWVQVTVKSLTGFYLTLRWN